MSLDIATWCQKAIDVLLVLTLIAFPLTFNIALNPVDDMSHSIISANFSVGDLLIGVVFAMWLLKLILRREKVEGLPVSILIFVLTLLLSGINSFSIKDWIKEMLQFIEYFVVFYLLLVNNARNWPMLKVRNILFVAASVILVIGVIQRMEEGSVPFLIRSVFENRNLFGIYLCIIVPLAFSDFVYSPSVLRAVWTGLIVIAGVTMTLSFGSLASMSVGILVVTIFSLQTSRFRALGGVAVIFMSVLFNVPERNFDEMIGSIGWYENGKINENYYRIINILERQEKRIVYERPIGVQQHLVVKTSLFASNTLPEQVNGSRYVERDQETHVKNRYLEMQASLNIVSDNVLTGIGLGNFQNQIGTYYGALPKVNTTEPDQHSGFFILATSIGLIGLTAFVWLLVTCLRVAYSGFRRAKAPLIHGEYLGIFAALTSATVQNFFSFILVTSVIGLFIILLFLTLRAQHSSDTITV